MYPVSEQSQLGPRGEEEEEEEEEVVAAVESAVGSMHLPSLHPPQSASATRMRGNGFRESEWGGMGKGVGSVGRFGTDAQQRRLVDDGV
jgi:hypothetical protein